MRTYRRWYRNGVVGSDQRPLVQNPSPSNKLSEQEREAIVEVANEPEYASLPPSQIVPILLDKSIYLGSESSFYRILKACKQLSHRGRSQAPKELNKPTSFTATGPILGALLIWLRLLKVSFTTCIYLKIFTAEK